MLMHRLPENLYEIVKNERLSDMKSGRFDSLYLLACLVSLLLFLPPYLFSQTIDPFAQRRESVRAKLRIMIKRILRKYGYPPDKQEQATLTVLEQAELLCKDLVK